MTTISAQVIADSVSADRVRLTTFLLRYPRAIHSELMTHRVFSRNASSSRAIPVKKLIQDVLDDPFIPLYWGKNQAGMQAGEEHNEMIPLWDDCEYYRDSSREEAWLKARDHAVNFARAFAYAGYHKQIINRLLEPFAHISVVVTATDFANFFALRNHPDAEPHIQALARSMLAAYHQSVPRLLLPGEWHLPFIGDDEWETIDNQSLIIDRDVINEKLRQVSTARCARTSYRLHDGSFPPLEKDLELFADLMISEPLHASPAEHQATPAANAERGPLTGNFRGWIQNRKLFANEFVADQPYDMSLLSGEDQLRYSYWTLTQNGD